MLFEKSSFEEGNKGQVTWYKLFSFYKWTKKAYISQNYLIAKYSKQKIRSAVLTFVGITVLEETNQKRKVKKKMNELKKMFLDTDEDVWSAEDFCWRLFWIEVLFWQEQLWRIRTWHR